MDEALQEAYNEWLLLWGFRWVEYSAVVNSKVKMADLTVVSYNDWHKCIEVDINYGVGVKGMDSGFRLKQPHEITNGRRTC